jgi:hypothetical protein
VVGMLPTRNLEALRRFVHERAAGVCEYCRSQACFSPQPFSVEHILPRSAGGDTTEDNLALSCQGCNGHKYIKQYAADPFTRQMAALFHPRAQMWRDHFAWSSDTTVVIGLTPTGRATVEALRMNRPELVSLHAILYAARKHPPSQPGD